MNSRDANTIQKVIIISIFALKEKLGETKQGLSFW